MNVFQIGWPLLAIFVPGFKLPSWTLTKLLEIYLEKGRCLLFLSTTSHANGVDELHNIANVFISMIGLLAKITTNLYYTSILSAFGISAFSIWLMISDFVTIVHKEHFMEESSSPRRANIRHGCAKKLDMIYREIVGAVHSINRAWSGPCLWFILYSCSWMSTRIDGILLATDNYLGAVDILEMFTFIAVLILSAESSRKAGKL